MTQHTDDFGKRSISTRKGVLPPSRTLGFLSVSVRSVSLIMLLRTSRVCSDFCLHIPLAISSSVLKWTADLSSEIFLILWIIALFALKLNYWVHIAR